MSVNLASLFFSIVIIIHLIMRLNGVIEGTYSRTIIMLLNFSFHSIAESLLVIRDTGVQLTKRYFSGKEKHMFIDKTHVKSIFINEGYRHFSYIFYMAFQIQGHDKLVLAFEVCFYCSYLFMALTIV